MHRRRRRLQPHIIYHLPILILDDMKVIAGHELFKMVHGRPRHVLHFEFRCQVYTFDIDIHWYIVSQRLFAFHGNFSLAFQSISQSCHYCWILMSCISVLPKWPLYSPTLHTRLFRLLEILSPLPLLDIALNIFISLIVSAYLARNAR